MPKHDGDALTTAEVSTSSSLGIPATTEDFQRLRAAADSDNAEAQYLLGLLHEDGDSALGVQQDEDVAIRWHYLAATKGHREAKFSLAYRMHSQLLFVWPTPAYFSSDEVIRWYTAAAEEGHAEAAWQLYLEFANRCELGDLEKAKHWHDVAISLGYDSTFPTEDREAD